MSHAGATERPDTEQKSPPQPQSSSWFDRVTPSLKPAFAKRAVLPRLSKRSRRESPASTEALKRLVIVGHGMVAQHFCERLVELGLLSRYRVAIFGEEPVPAYDRVQLGKAFQDGNTSQLELKNKAWFEQHGILLRTNARVTRISRDEATIETDKGDFVAYDLLVLATGSSPARLKLVPCDSARTRVYRTASDLQWICEQTKRAKADGLPALVIGAGLLGLEVAEALSATGLEVLVLESSAHLLPRQLDKHSANFVAQRWSSDNTRLLLGSRLDSYEETPSHVQARLDDGRVLRASFAIVAIGIRPRDELAREAQLQCDLFGGVEIDSALQTSDKSICAIGECARFEGMTYGLVAPGYEMANVLAERLAGKPSLFRGAPVATRLKSSRVQLSVFGQSAVNDAPTPPLRLETAQTLRRLVLERGRIAGATIVGQWDELPALQQIIARQIRFQPRLQKRFLRGDNVWGAQTVSLQTWPDDAVVCTCTGVTCKALKAAYTTDCKTLEALQSRTGAGSVCGSCTPLVSSLITGPVATGVASGFGLLAAATLAAGLSLLIFAAPPIPLTTSVRDFAYDALWRDGVIKQATGFGLLALFLATGLGFSLRKRWARLSWGTFSDWRLAHVFLGVTCLVGALVHTGFRLGKNLDLLLMLAFLTTSLVGAVASAFIGLESKFPADRATAYRRVWTRLHIYLLWPLPVLLIFHVVKVYYF